jgi:hypothetical protein
MRTILLALTFILALPSLADELADPAVLDDLRQKVAGISTGTPLGDVRLALGFPYQRSIERVDSKIRETWTYPVGSATSATLVFDDDRLTTVSYEKAPLVFTREKRGMSQRDVQRRIAIESIQIGQRPQEVERLAKPHRRLKRSERALLLGMVAGIAAIRGDASEEDAKAKAEEQLDQIHVWVYQVADVETTVMFYGPEVANIFEAVTPTKRQQALLRQKLW